MSECVLKALPWALSRIHTGKSSQQPRSKPPRKLGSFLAERIFRGFLFLSHRIFFSDFVAAFLLLIFVGKSAQKNPPEKSPAKSSKFYTPKSPIPFCRGARPKKVQPHDCGTIVSKSALKQARNKSAKEAAILNCVLDRD